MASGLVSDGDLWHVGGGGIVGRRPTGESHEGSHHAGRDDRFAGVASRHRVATLGGSASSAHGNPPADDGKPVDDGSWLLPAIAVIDIADQRAGGGNPYRDRSRNPLFGD